MEIEKREKEIVINLTREEVFDLQAGEIIGARPAVTMPDAKITIMPLSMMGLDDSLKDRSAIDRLEKAIKAPLRIILFPDGDLDIGVPAIKLSDSRLASAKLPRESIETPITDDRKCLLKAVPEGGIKLNFGGSLKIVHISDFFL